MNAVDIEEAISRLAGRPFEGADLKPGACAAMTAFPSVRSHSSCESSRDRELTRGCRPRYRLDGKIGRVRIWARSNNFRLRRLTARKGTNAIG